MVFLKQDYASGKPAQKPKKKNDTGKEGLSVEAPEALSPAKG